VLKSVPQRGSVWLGLGDHSRLTCSHTLPRCGTDFDITPENKLKLFGASIAILLSILWVYSVPAQHTPFDSYGNICVEVERARLDNFAVQLQNQKSYVGYIIVYAGQSSCVDEAKYRGKRAKDCVVKRGVPSERVVVIDGGYREEVQTVLTLTDKERPVPLPSSELEKSQVSIHKCVDKVFARVLCPNQK
jgi:hypothetical protein